MRLEASLHLRQEMRLKLAPQIIQSIEILQLPLLDLRNRIDQELLENPMLEMTQMADESNPGEESPGEETATELEAVEAPKEEPESEEEPISSEDFDALADLIPQYEDAGEFRRRTPASGEKDAKLAALENSPAPGITLQEHLSDQIAYLDLQPEIRILCQNIIANLDWRGYLEYPLQDVIASIEDIELTIEQAEEALKVVQQLDPAGVGARSIQECLLLQLGPQTENHSLLHALIQSHLDDVVRNRYPRVARALGITIEQLKETVVQLGRLNPMPGALFGESSAPHVIPDVRVEFVEGEYRVMLEDTTLPSLRICSYYARRLQQEGLDDKTQAYLREKLQSARWLIDAIQQRRSTLFNITTAIVVKQKEFLDKGLMFLKPLKMQDIADEVSVHVSTVSRAMAGKYVQTPRGIYPLKHFFTGGVEKEDGEFESWEVVRQKLLNVIANEDKSHPLSDEQVAGQLRGQGIDIARRTVSKYRKVLGIASSRRRREY